MLKIFCPRKFPFQNIGYKNNFGPNKFLVKTIFGLTKFGSEKIWGPRNSLFKNVGSKKFRDQKIVGSKKILSLRKLDPKSFKFQKNFGYVEILGQKRF